MLHTTSADKLSKFLEMMRNCVERVSVIHFEILPIIEKSEQSLVNISHPIDFKENRDYGDLINTENPLKQSQSQQQHVHNQYSIYNQNLSPPNYKQLDSHVYSNSNSYSNLNSNPNINTNPNLNQNLSQSPTQDNFQSKRSSIKMENILSTILNKSNSIPSNLALSWSKQFEEISEGNSTVSMGDFVKMIPYIGSNQFGRKLFLTISNYNFEMNENDFRDSLRIMTLGDLETRYKIGFSLFDSDNTNLITFQSFRETLHCVFQIIETLLGYQLFHENLNSINIDSIISNLFFSICKEGNIITKSMFKDYVKNTNNRLSVLGILPVENIPNRIISSKIGYPVSFGHSSWSRILIMMAGITRSLLSISKTNTLSQSNQPIQTGSDCSNLFKSKFQCQIPNERFLEPTTFVSFCPEIFQEIRKLFKINENEYRKSFSIEHVFGQLLCGSLATLSEKITDGKSGNFFYSSYDGLFLAKTISSNEFDTLRHILPRYYAYVSENDNTLLTRLYGLYKIDDIPFIVMESVFKTSNCIDTTFDLKGSSFGRTGSQNSILKDLDWKHSGRRLKIELGLSYILKEQIQKDVHFLKSMEMIDYSLIIGISENNSHHYNTSYERSIFQRHSSGIQGFTNNSNIVYYVGIIDFLVTYNMKKKAEKFIKVLYTGNDESISVAHPEHYADRFLNFVQTQVI